jgi:hypothetical protein
MIEVYGGTESQKKYVKSIVEFCIKTMMPRMKNSLYVEIRLKKLNGSAHGYCLACNEDGERADRPRTFELEIDKSMKMRNLLETVAHEMVHVKQYARSELYQNTRDNTHRWQGKWLKKQLNYWDQPWEIEAHGREIGLFVRWAEEQRLGNKKWTQIS